MSERIIFDLIGNDLLSGVFDSITSTIEDVIGGAIRLAGTFEQTQIAFTSMLGGDRAAADALLSQLQTLANYTPFTFADESAAARQLLAMGQSAEKVLPELKDIDTAVSAIGGGDRGVGLVAAALSKIDAAGKTTARYLNELTSDNFPAWEALAEEMGLSVAQVRALSEEGKIASSVFDQAFHDYTVKHWGDAVAQQSQTFDGLMSTASDLGVQFEKTFGAPIIQALEPKLKGILNALSDPAVITAIQQWGVEAGTFLTRVLEAGVEIAQWAGLPIPNLDQLAQDSGAAALNSAAMNVSWTGIPPQILTAKEQADALDTKIADLRDKTDDLNRSYTQQIDPLRAQLTALDQIYQIQNATHSLVDDQQKLADDRLLSGNRFSAQGAAARHAVAADQQAIARDQRALDQDNAKNKLTNQIAGLEAAKKRADDEAAYQIQVWERTKRTLQDIIIAPAIRPTVDAGFLAHEGALTADRFTKQVITTATPKQPDILAAIFGTDKDWAGVGTQIAGGVATTIGGWAWEALGKELGGGLLGGVLQGLTSPAATGDAGAVFAAIGAKARASMAGDDAGIKTADTALAAAYKQAFGDLVGGAAAATVLQPPGAQLDPTGLPGSGNPHTPSGDARPGGGAVPPANPPPGRSANRGHYIFVGNAWVWRDDDPTNTAASVYPTPGSGRGAGDGGSGAGYYPYGAPVSPTGGTLPTAYTGFYPSYSGMPSYPGTTAGAEATGAGVSPVNVTVNVTVNGMPQTQQQWNAFGAQISQAVADHLYGGR